MKSESKIARIESGEAFRAALRSRRDALVRQHLGLVAQIAMRISRSLPPSFDIEDLVGVGNLALLDCATRYQPARHGGTPFSAFARQRIGGAILDSVRRRHYLENTRPSVDEVAPPAEACKVDGKIDRKRMWREIASAIALMPAPQQVAIRAEFFGEPGPRKGIRDAVMELRREVRLRLLVA